MMYNAKRNTRSTLTCNYRYCRKRQQTLKEKERIMKRLSTILIGMVVVICLAVVPAFAKKSKGVSTEDAQALKAIGIDLSSSSAEEIEKKAIAIERLVEALKGLSEARSLEAKARQEEVKAEAAEFKHQMAMEKAALKSQAAKEKLALKKAKAEQKAKDKTFAGGVQKGVGKEITKGTQRATKTAINDFIKDIFK